MVPGTYTITYNHTDYAGNDAIPVTRTIEVVDTTGPVITLYGSALIKHPYRTPYLDLGASAHDLVDGNVNEWIQLEGEVDPNQLESIT